MLGLVAVCAAAPAAHAHDSHGPDPRAVDRGAGARFATAASAWCGTRVRHDLPGRRAAPFRYHAVYLLPRDGRSRFRRVAASLQADAFGASALLERLYGRAIRFDMGTSCGPQYLDISQFRLSATRAKLRRLAASRDQGALFDFVRRDMRRAGFLVTIDKPFYEGRWGPQTINYLAWLDGPAARASCGQATSLVDRRRAFWNANNLGGKVALVFRRGRDFCGPATIRHEIGHNLGALQPQAPNTRDGAHCTDALEDTMCVDDAPRVGGGPKHGEFFDYRNDDYWDPPTGRPLKWWTVNLSWFICPDARCNRP